MPGLPSSNWQSLLTQAALSFVCDSVGDKPKLWRKPLSGPRSTTQVAREAGKQAPHLIVVLHTVAALNISSKDCQIVGHWHAI